MKSSCKNIKVFPVESKGSNFVKLGFDFIPVPKAIQYQFHLKNKDVDVAKYTVTKQMIDSSKKVQVL